MEYIIKAKNNKCEVTAFIRRRGSVHQVAGWFSCEEQELWTKCWQPEK